MNCDTVWTGARLATLDPSRPGLGCIEDGVIAARDGRILYVGPRSEAPALRGRRTIACEGRWVTPGLVDAHTHLVYAGDRSAEFEQRLEGLSYEDLARAGGGIASTMRATRASSEDALVAAALPRLDALLAEGVTTIEVKSGYGLEPEGEYRMLRAARRLGELRPVRVTTTLLAAHALPPEYAADRRSYVDLVCGEMIPRAAAEGLADAVDAFCEGIAFTPSEVREVFTAARAQGLPVRLHADQLSNLGGAALAAEFAALSADHLEYTDEAGVRALAAAGSVAMLLPGAFYTTRETRTPPIEALRRHGVPIALATDSNPGSSPLTSLLLVLNLGATLFRLTVAECLAAVTREGARAAGLLADVGTLEAGKSCDLAIWNVERPAELVYRMGFNPLHARVWRGE